MNTDGGSRSRGRQQMWVWVCVLCTAFDRLRCTMTRNSYSWQPWAVAHWHACPCCALRNQLPEFLVLCMATPTPSTVYGPRAVCRPRYRGCRATPLGAAGGSRARSRVPRSSMISIICVHGSMGVPVPGELAHGRETRARGEQRAQELSLSEEACEAAARTTGGEVARSPGTHANKPQRQPQRRAARLRASPGGKERARAVRCHDGSRATPTVAVGVEVAKARQRAVDRQLAQRAQALALRGAGACRTGGGRQARAS